MRWRKQDYTTQERKDERQFGFFACLGINVAILLARRLLANAATGDPSLAGTNTELFLLALPWIVNIGILALALTFRPHFAMGYLAFFTAMIISSIVLGTAFVAACFASILTMVILNPLGEAGSFVALVCVLPVAFFAGLYYLGKALFPPFSRWWSGE